MENSKIDFSQDSVLSKLVNRYISGYQIPGEKMWAGFDGKPTKWFRYNWIDIHLKHRIGYSRNNPSGFKYTEWEINQLINSFVQNQNWSRARYYIRKSRALGLNRNSRNGIVGAVIGNHIKLAKLFGSRYKTPYQDLCYALQLSCARGFRELVEYLINEKGVRATEICAVEVWIDTASRSRFVNEYSKGCLEVIKYFKERWGLDIDSGSMPIYPVSEDRINKCY
jgi:hypothetical protein